MSNSPQSDFLSKLQEEAALQAKLEHHRLIPPQLDFITSFIGRYPWQVFLVLSFITALIIEISRGWS